MRVDEVVGRRLGFDGRRRLAAMLAAEAADLVEDRLMDLNRRLLSEDQMIELEAGFLHVLEEFL